MIPWLKRQLERLKTPVGSRTALIAVLVAVALVPAIAHADIISWFWNIIASMFLFFTKLLGFLTSLV